MRHLLLAVFAVIPFAQCALLRDAAYGVPLIIGGTAKEAFTALGRAHCEDRLFQVFLRYAASNGRLSEFLPWSQMNFEADMLTRLVSYTDDELQAQFTTVMNADARAVYSAFAAGMQQCVEQTTEAPYEFTALGVPWPLPKDLFSLNSVLRYALFTMRRF
jgi:acyl-homoserine lactone acylase PvdQ